MTAADRARDPVRDPIPGAGPGVRPGAQPVVWLDERGRLCPLPVIALSRAQREHPPGTVVGLLADDPAAEVDVPAWCRLRGGDLVAVRPARDGGPGRTYVVRLPDGPGPAPPNPRPDPVSGPPGSAPADR